MLSTTTDPTLVEAVLLVAADQRADYPDMSVAEAVDHARDILATPEQGGGPGWAVVEDDGTELSIAYLAVLRALPDDLTAAEAEAMETERA